jgi:undecaprenyl-diphosphatase
MEWITLIEAFFLGVVEGLTEFLPVSSTGHLILLVDLLHFKAPPGKLFEIVIQLGAILAVCWIYRKKLLNTVLHLPSSQSSRYFTFTLALAFLPAMIIGALAHDFIKHTLFNPWVVSFALIIGGVMILLIEKQHIAPRHHNAENLPLHTALAIGFFQTLAMVPGVSRSGATIMGSLLLKVDRRAATEFSFFLAIPTMAAATFYDIYKNFHSLSLDNVAVIAIGFISAFLSALLVVSTLISFISSHGFRPFAFYRITLGVIMLGLLVARG